MILTYPLSGAENHKTWSKGRRCRHDGCETILSQHNGTRACSVHGGWQPKILRNLDVKREQEAFMGEVKDIMEQVD